jgi:hypothetical protein
MKNLKTSKCEVALQQYAPHMYSATVKTGTGRYRFFSRQKKTAEKLYGIFTVNCPFTESGIHALLSLNHVTIERSSGSNYFVSL